LGAIRAEAAAGERAEILFFCPLNNAQFHRLSVGQISQNLHKRRVSVSSVGALEKICENLPIRGLFPQKPPFWLDQRQRFPTSGRDFSETIRNLGKHDRLARLWNVGFPVTPLE